MSAQQELLNGPTLESFDHARLARQRKAVFMLMRDSRWRTLAEIAAATGYPEASISARLRDFRKAKYGAHQVDRQRRYAPERGLWEYRLMAVQPAAKGGE